jgi:hypothetical protein
MLRKALKKTAATDMAHRNMMHFLIRSAVLFSVLTTLSLPSYAQTYRDSDGDGYSDLNDSCPNDAEDFDGFGDEDGCPDLDNDRDGILDPVDQCPNQPEDFDGILDHDGCQDE